MRSFALAAALVIAGCAGLSPAPTTLPARSALGDFAMEARFVLRTERPNERAQSASGRLSWQHGGSGDRILVATPLGQGIAELAITPATAELRTSDGLSRRADDAGALLASITGYSLPLGELPSWLLGRPTAAGRLESDALGRPHRLTDAGWRIDYHYDNDSADAPPSRLTILREGELELRLRIEDWRLLPHD